MITAKSLSPYCAIFICLFLHSCSSPSGNEEQKQESQQATESPANGEQSQTILFFGNSLTEGLGVDDAEAYPAEIRKILDSLHYDYEVINAGLSGETTAAGKNRISWVLNQPVDIFVLELGANDGLRGIPLQETRRNLQAIIDTVKKKSPEAEIILAGMQIPPNMGPEYTEEFQQIYPDLAEKNDTYLIPFLLKGVAGRPELNQDDGIHPNAEGYDIVAQNVWETLQKVVEKE